MMHNVHMGKYENTLWGLVVGSWCEVWCVTCVCLWAVLGNEDADEERRQWRAVVKFWEPYVGTGKGSEWEMDSTHSFHCIQVPADRTNSHIYLCDMVVGLSVMLPFSAAHVVPLTMADECPSPLKSRDTPKKYGACGTANATPKYGDIALDLPIQSSLQVRNLGINNLRRRTNGLDSIVSLINPFLHWNSELFLVGSWHQQWKSTFREQ